MEPYPLRSGDILTKIGEYSIDNAGMVRVADHHFKFQYLVQRLARGNKVRVTVVRDGQQQTVDVPWTRLRTAGFSRTWSGMHRPTSSTGHWFSRKRLIIMSAR